MTFEKVLPVHRPLNTHFDTVTIPERFRFCDAIEVRVVLTPLRWRDGDMNQADPIGEKAYSEIRITRIYMQESRAVASIVKQMIRNLFLEFFDLKDIF